MTRTSIRLPLALIGTAALLVFGASAYAGDSMKEAATAAQHAGLAAKSANVNQVHMHLHHVVNCLVGPKGEGFDPNNANPCAAAGDGAIPDATDNAAKQKLEGAVKTAMMGLHTDDLAAAQKAAMDTQSELK
jgi:hypothetical protein